MVYRQLPNGNIIQVSENSPLNSDSFGRLVSSPSSSEQPKSDTWFLSDWRSTVDANGNGVWVKQPVLTVNGQQKIFSTPQEYVAELQRLQAQPGQSGNLGLFITQLQGAVGSWTPQRTQSTSSSVVTPTSSAPSAGSVQSGPSGMVYRKTPAGRVVQLSASSSLNSDSYGTLVPYEEYARQMGIPLTTQQPTPPSPSQPLTIPFRQGMTPSQQESINSLVRNKPSSQWNSTDIANWNFATNNAPLPQNTSSSQPVNPSSSPMITSTGNPVLDEYLRALQTQLDGLVSQGRGPLPNIEIDGATLSRFLSEATTELDPYYQSIYKGIEADLKATMDDIQAQYEDKKISIGEDFRSTLESSRESMADRGVFFSGNRGRREGELKTSTDRRLKEEARKASSMASSYLRDAEAKIGTTRTLSVSPLSATSFTYPSADLNTRSLSGISSTPAYNPLNIRGSVEADRDTQIRLLKSSKELEERNRRALNYYNN